MRTLPAVTSSARQGQFIATQNRKPSRRNCRVQTPTNQLLQAGQCFGFLNLSTKLSASPIATYFARSLSPSVSVGGSVHTPSGQSFVSFGLASTSDEPTNSKPACFTRLIA